jgi:hypothetical protein
MSKRSGSEWVRSAVIGGALLAAGAVRAQTVDRSVEAVVITGARLPQWSRLAATVACAPYPSGTTGARDAHNGTLTVPPDVRTGVPVEEIAAYRWNGLGFTEIPVQVDEKYPYCLSNPPSAFSFYSGTDQELTYAWDVESWMKTDGTCTASYPPGAAPLPDPVAGLDDDDEIVFMARDAGPQAPLAAPPPPGANDGQAIALIDPLDHTAPPRFVYLFRKSGGSSFSAANGYVSYVRDADADEWIDRYSLRADDPEILGVSNTDYGPNLHGPVCRTATYPGYPMVTDGVARPSIDRFVRDGVTVSTATYTWRATGRWMVRGLRLAQPGQPGVYGPDLIDRWKGRAFQQSPDSTISLVGFEDEQVNWEANSALLGERRGPVRALREVWGADSGTNVTKTETFYRDAIAYHYHVRVHPIPPDGLYTSWDYNAGVAVRYYNRLKPAGVAIDGQNDDVGNVDGVFGFPAYFDAPDPTFNAPSALLNWEEISGAGAAGSLVYILELKGATTVVNPAVVPYYRDDACLDDGTGDNPVPRPWPGAPSTDPRVQDGYSAENGGIPYDQLTCAQRQGVWGAHGVHYFFSGDSDNLASPEVLTEIDAQQWQFTVPTAAPANIGERYGNVIVAPLLAAITPLAVLPTGVAPHAADGSAATEQGIAVTAALGGVDLASCDLTFTIVSPPAHGSLGPIVNAACSLGLPSSDTATVSYTPAAGFHGSDQFAYKVNDGVFDSAPATIALTVKPAAPPTCATGPVAGCALPSRSGFAPLRISHGSSHGADRLTWHWHPGTALPADFGTPQSTTHYQLCVFDADGRTVARASAPAGAMCGTKPCWRASSRKLWFQNRALRLTLKPSATRSARISAVAHGPALGLAGLPVNQPLVVQLKTSDGRCWEARYSAPAGRNDGATFRDHAD